MSTRDTIMSGFSNILVWLDFGLFIYFAPIIGKQFFPSTDVHTASLAAFTVFASGFICRPLGGILWGYLGDSIGRVKTLRICILLISFTTFVTGILPGYQILGISASILFTFLRLLQGLAIGGEYCGAMIYLAETATTNMRGRQTSIAAMGANMGFLLATFCASLLHSHLFSHFLLDVWLWRIPFIIIGLGGLLLFYYRLNLRETAAFIYLQEHNGVENKPLMIALRFAPKTILQIIGLSAMGASFYYVFFGYMPNFLAEYLNVSITFAFNLQIILLLVMITLVPLAGYCGDRWGRKKMLLITTIVIIGFVFPAFYLLKLNSVLLIVGVLSIATILSSFEQGNSLATVVEICPLNVRYSGIAFAYNLGNAVFGGLAPLIVELLTHSHGLFAPAWYLTGATLFTLVTVLVLPKRIDFNNILLKI